MGLNLTFSAMRDDFIQVLHDAYGHWFTISNIETQKFNEVLIYESMFHSLSDHGRKQVAALLACFEKNITIKMMGVQQQKGGSDCGLFDTAFATDLSNQVQLGCCVFHQNEMRNHSLKSLQKQFLSMFTIANIKKESVRVKSTGSIDILCSC